MTPLDVDHLFDALWDEDAGLFRLAPGAAPGRDLSALDLHPVRESALGAYHLLGRGDRDRAARVLANVLRYQYDAPGTPWDGTFKVTAEEPDPPADAEEWVHYDPNWRQFVGCTLAVVVEDFGEVLEPALVDRIRSAIERCVLGEPDDRIPRWYTNPNLMHAWLAAWIGDPVGDERRAMVVERFERHGDVDEYNSPTYDGVDLLALGLWATLPPSPAFEADGERLLAAMGARISRLFHPGLAAVCGPYIRSYGIDLDEYVSFLGMWWAMAGQATLPPRLTVDTDHAHDLSFVPLLGRVADAVLPHLVAAPVERPRSHGQRFGAITATSLLGPDSMVGVESGRRGTFSRDQYVPLVAHWLGTGDEAQSLAIYVDDTTQVDAVAHSPTEAVATVWSDDGDVVVYAAGRSVGDVLRWCTFSAPPTIAPSARYRAPVELRWPAGSTVELRLELS